MTLFFAFCAMAYIGSLSAALVLNERDLPFAALLLDVGSAVFAAFALLVAALTAQWLICAMWLAAIGVALINIRNQCRSVRRARAWAELRGESR